MRKYSIDTVLRVRLTHRPGRLARLATVLAEQGALLGEITTVRIGEDDTVRDITVETEDESHTERVVAAVRGMEDAAATEESAVVPSPLDPSVHQAVRQAAADAARRQGLAGTARVA